MELLMPAPVADLVVRQVGDDWVVVTPGRSRALVLDSRCAEVFQLCDGSTSTEAVVRSLSEQWSCDFEKSREVLEQHLDWLRVRGVVSPEFMPLCSEKIVSEQVGDEVLVVESQRALLLNPTAAKVLSACDGQTRVSDVVGTLSQQGLDAEAAHQTLWMSLAQLRRHNLLGSAVALPESPTRRAFLQRWAVAAVALPVITALALPQPAAAASECIQGGTPVCQSTFGLAGRITSCTPCCGTASCACTGTSFCMTRYEMTGAGCSGDPVQGVVCGGDGGPGSSSQQICGGLTGAENNSVLVGSNQVYTCCECL